ncbi:MAG: DUF2520 domain-containing protein [Solirubrobacteraceae bacterium]
MRELERLSEPSDHETALSVAIVGAGRLGTALACALVQSGIRVDGPLGRGALPAGVDAVLLCVPDAEIAAAAAPIRAGQLVGHCSGATGLEALAGREAFSLHPLMTLPGGNEARHAPGSAPDSGPSPFSGATAAIAGTSPAALTFARRLAIALGLRPALIADGDRAAYHAAASIASNFVLTLEAAAERLAATAGLGRADLVPLVRATVENWASLGAERALTGPVARGDEQTVERQRQAVAERMPELRTLFDELVEATRALAGPIGTAP